MDEPGRLEPARLLTDPARWPVVSTRDGEFVVEGADHVEHTEDGVVFHRLPASAIDKISSEFFRIVESQPSGVRLVMTTRATAIELLVTTTATVFFPDDPVPSFGRVELLIDGASHADVAVSAGRVREMDILTNSSSVRPGDHEAVVRFDGLPAREKTVELWLPHDVEVAVASLRADAPVTAVRRSSTRWLSYGSSITHGVAATTPTGTWAATAARHARISLVNLGFSGNAMLDYFVAEAIRDCPADIISLELGINVINHDGFRARTFVPAVMAFLDIIREGHPETPLWVVSSVLCPIVEDRPGPTMMVGAPGERRTVTEGLPHEVVRGRLSLSLIRDLLQQIVERRGADDPNLHYLDGRELYGEREYASMPMKDDLHPDAEAHRHIGERFAELVLGVDPHPESGSGD